MTYQEAIKIIEEMLLCGDHSRLLNDPAISWTWEDLEEAVGEATYALREAENDLHRCETCIHKKVPIGGDPCCECMFAYTVQWEAKDD